MAVTRAAWIFGGLMAASITLQAKTELQKLYGLYQAGQYKDACNYGLRIFNRHKKNNDFIMLYGFSCLKADYIDRLAVPLTALRYTPTERKNATYFATILLQKKMLFQSLMDHVDISGVRLPVTDHVLSIVFDLYVRKRYDDKQKYLLLQNEADPAVSYHLFIERHSRGAVMVIEEYRDGQLFKEHRYW